MAKKAIHYCFLLLFILAESLAIICLVFGLLKMFSERASGVLHVVEWGFVFLWLSLVIAVKLVLKVKYLKKTQPQDMHDLGIKYVLFHLLAIVTFLTGYYAWGVNSQVLHSFVFQIVAYISFFWDLAFVRPLLKK